MAYPRIHFGGGGTLDLGYVPPEAEAAFEQEWRAVHCRVEWLATPKGRLDPMLPQTLPRIVHNANARSHSQPRERRNVTG